MEMVLKITNALKDGEISFSEIAELLNDLKSLDLKKLKKLLNYLSLAALFVPQLKPYAIYIQALRNVLNGGSIRIDDIVNAIPEGCQKSLRNALAFTPGILNTSDFWQPSGEESYLQVINQLMDLLNERFGSNYQPSKNIEAALSGSNS